MPRLCRRRSAGAFITGVPKLRSHRFVRTRIRRRKVTGQGGALTGATVSPALRARIGAITRVTTPYAAQAPAADAVVACQGNGKAPSRAGLGAAGPTSARTAGIEGPSPALRAAHGGAGAGLVTTTATPVVTAGRSFVARTPAAGAV